MATLYITEFGGHAFVGASSNQSVQIPSASAVLAYQNISISASSAASAAFNANTRMIKICSDTNVWLNFGPTNSVTATVAQDYLPAGVVLYYAVNPGSYLAAIT